MAILAVYSSCSNPEGKESAIANAKDEVEVVSTVLSESVPVERCQQSVRQQLFLNVVFATIQYRDDCWERLAMAVLFLCRSWEGIAQLANAVHYTANIYHPLYFITVAVSITFKLRG